MHRRRRALAALFVVALALRLVFLAADPNPWESAGLSAGHGEMARNIVDGGRWFVVNQNARELGERQIREQRLVDPSDVDFSAADARPRYAPMVLETPGSAILLAGLWAVSGDKDYVYLQVLQALLDAAMVPLVFWIALRLYGRERAALLAAGLYALFLPLAFLAKIPHLDIWGVHATIAVFALIVKARHSERAWPWLAAAGIVTGAGLYFRPALLILPATLALALVPIDGWRRALRFGLVPSLIAAVLIAPWTVRNYVEFDAFIPIRIGVGQNLWEGLGEIPNDFGAVLDDQRTYEQVLRDRPDLLYGSPEYDEHLQDKASAAIAANPGHYARVVARRAVMSTVLMRNVWLPYEETPPAYAARTGKGYLDFASERPWETVKVAITALMEPLMFMLAMLTAALTARRWWRRHLLLLAVPVATIAPYLILHVEPRYILPASFVYMILVGLGADLLGARLARRRASITSAEPAASAR